MLIKVITPYQDIVIIENVTDVRVKGGMCEYRPYGLTESIDNLQEFFFDDCLEATPSKDDLYHARVIYFAKDGPCRLYITKLAYICNDEGRTLEKVVCGPDTI